MPSIPRLLDLFSIVTSSSYEYPHRANTNIICASYTNTRTIRIFRDCMKRYKSAYIYNILFSRIGTRLAENIDASDIDPLSFVTPTPHNFEFQTISHDKVREEIKQMKTAKSSGYDKISVKLSQAAGGAIVVPLTYIFNQSLKTGIFPDDWKIAKVTPIHKSEKKPYAVIIGRFLSFL